MIRLAGFLISTRISRFALIGASGAVLNILIMMALIGFGTNYMSAAIVAGEITIITNFILQEKLAFADLSDHRRPLAHRFFHSFTFNTLEAVARVPLLWILVEYFHLPSLIAQAGTLCAAFFIRYAFHVKFVYARQSLPVSAKQVQAPALWRVSLKRRGASLTRRDPGKELNPAPSHRLPASSVSQGETRVE